MKRSADKFLLFIIIALSIIGIIIFSSASLGLLTRDGANLSTVASKQILIGLIGGFASLSIISKINYKNWRPLAPYIFLLTLAATAAVFIPGHGMSAGGATRWLLVGPVSIQPSEFLKLGFVLILAFIFSSQTKVESWKNRFAPFLAILGIIAFILLKQPDTGTFMIFFFSGMAMFLVSGCTWKHIATMTVIMAIGGGALVYTRPYIKERVLTFIDPSRDSQGSSYQIQQALIAIGSGEIFGRGFGQSVQKFNFLPEPIGDSVFAVASEEFGFVGSATIIILFLLFGIRGLWIAMKISDQFGRLLAVGIVILVVSQSFINISAMLGLIPLTGVPLLFISHGGTALLLALIECGILLNISKYKTP